MRSELSNVLEALEPSTVCDMIGEYRITSQIGEGGMGTVYAAVHPVIGKRVAIKVMRADLGANPDAVERFVREAQAINRIGHPNIVDVFGFGTLPDGRHYYVMAHLSGKTLGDRMRTPMTLGECVVIVDQIARALEAAHDAAVVHRDLKPENVFLAEVRGEAPRATLLDFGIAKLTDDAIDQTAAGMMVGTPLYASPEQARGLRVDTRSDIYTLGVMMFEMMAGTLPFVSTSSHELLAQHVGELAPRAIEHHAGLPRAIDDLLAAMLAKDPDARPSLATIRAALAPFATDTSQPITWAPRSVVRVRARGSVAPATLPLTPSVRAAPPAPSIIVESGELLSRFLPMPRSSPTPRPTAIETPRRRWPLRLAVACVVIASAIVIGGWLGARRASTPSPSPLLASPAPPPAPHIEPIEPIDAIATPPRPPITTPTVPPESARVSRTKRATTSRSAVRSRARGGEPAASTTTTPPTTPKAAPSAQQIRDPLASTVHDPFATP